MAETDDTRREIAAARERLTELTHELARRADPDLLKARAKEMIVEKTTELKHRLQGSPLAWGILAGAATWAGTRLYLSYRERHEREARLALPPHPAMPADETMTDEGSHEPGLGEKARDKARALKQRAADGYERTKERVGEAARRLEDERPIGLAIGALALGLALGLLVPLSSRERRMTRPLRAKARETAQSALEQVKEKVDDLERKTLEPKPPSPPTGIH